MDKVDAYIRALDKIPKDNGRNLTWGYALVSNEGQDCVLVTMQDRWTRPTKYYQRFIPFDYIYATEDQEDAANNLIELMYTEAEEHMSPSEALGHLNSLLEDVENGFVNLYRNYEEVAESLKVAIECLKEKCHE